MGSLWHNPLADGPRAIAVNSLFMSGSWKGAAGIPFHNARSSRSLRAASLGTSKRASVFEVLYQALSTSGCLS